jgi:outer membrane lipoprotein-sorting protein
MRGTTFWMYFPKAKKSIIMHPTNSLTGSLSIGDMVSPPLLEIYELSKAGKADDGTLIVTFRAKDARAPYGMIAYRYRDGVVISQECSTRSGIVLKRVSYSDFVQTDGGSAYASKVRVVNAVYPGYASTIEIRDLTRVPAFPDSFFTPEGMDNAHE